MSAPDPREPPGWHVHIRGPETFDGIPVAHSDDPREAWYHSWSMARAGEDHIPGRLNDLAGHVLETRGEVGVDGRPLPDEEAFLAACARECTCEGWDVPCAGVTAGGVCDRVEDPRADAYWDEREERGYR